MRADRFIAILHDEGFFTLERYLSRQQLNTECVLVNLLAIARAYRLVNGEATCHRLEDVFFGFVVKRRRYSDHKVSIVSSCSSRHRVRVVALLRGYLPVTVRVSFRPVNVVTRTALPSVTTVTAPSLSVR